MMDEKMINLLIEKAIDVREFSYSPYSNFKVGAALLTKKGEIFVGTNIENAAYSPTICAERSAIAKAISEGEKEFSAIAVVGEELCTPCGVCRQFLSEFVDAQTFLIICASIHGEYKVYTMEELLPHGFVL